MASIRVIAIGVFRIGSRILAAPGFDPTTGEHFFRPLGGGVEFGETLEEALRREMREELTLEIEAPRLLGVLENRFTWSGRPSHEIVFVFDARFVDQKAYALDELPFTESGREGAAVWLDLQASPLPAPLYPEGLAALLATDESSIRGEWRGGSARRQ